MKIQMYRTIILAVVLCGCDAWSLKLRRDDGLRLLENRVPRRIFGPKREDVTEKWIRIHNEIINDLYSSLNITMVIISRTIGLAGHVLCTEERKGAYGVLVGKSDGMRLFGRPRLK